MTHRNADNICRLRNVPVNSLFVLPGRRDSVYLYRGEGKNGIGYGVKMSTRTVEEIPAGYLDYWVIQIKDVDLYYKDVCVARLFNNTLWIMPETPQL